MITVWLCKYDTSGSPVYRMAEVFYKKIEKGVDNYAGRVVYYGSIDVRRQQVRKHK